MHELTVRGIVPEFESTEFLLPVEDEGELSRFWRTERIDTTYTLKYGKPTVKVRGQLASFCKPGDRIEVRIEAFDRSDGRRVRAVGLTVLNRRSH